MIEYIIREGVTMKFLQTGEGTNGKFSLIEAEYNKHCDFPIHIHTKENELFYVIEGDIDFLVGKDIINITSGNSIYLPNKVKHGFKINSEIAKVLIMIEPAGLEGYFKTIGLYNLNNPNLEMPNEQVKALLQDFGITILSDEIIN